MGVADPLHGAHCRADITYILLGAKKGTRSLSKAITNSVSDYHSVYPSLQQVNDDRGSAACCSFGF